jgi:uncharacterized repeat protein (TIGR01451 family)
MLGINFVKRILFIAFSIAVVAIISLIQSNVLKVEASVQVLVVSHTAIPFGNVFPGEENSETYTVALDTSSNFSSYTTSLEPLPGMLDLCPLLEIKNIDLPTESDNFNIATLTRPADVLDKWQVILKTPAIEGQVSQDHDGKIIVKGGEYGCKIIIITHKTPEVAFKKRDSVDKLNEKITYTLAYDVTGSGSLMNVVITDKLPDHLTFISATNGGTYNSTTGVVTWNLGTLISPTSAFVQVTTGRDKNFCKFENTATFSASNLSQPLIANHLQEFNDCNSSQRVKGGCTPGYWKQEQHFDSWVAYTTTTQFSSVFENAFPGKTLLDVLKLNGGSLNKLGAHTVAALLNSKNPAVGYAYTTGQVIQMFNDAYPNGDYNKLKDKFEKENEKGCPLN